MVNGAVHIVCTWSFVVYFGSIRATWKTDVVLEGREWSLVIVLLSEQPSQFEFEFEFKKKTLSLPARTRNSHLSSNSNSNLKKNFIFACLDKD